MFNIILLAFACMYVNFTQAVEDLFSVKADDMFETIVGDVLKEKKNMNKLDFDDIIENLMKQNASLKNITQFLMTKKTNVNLQLTTKSSKKPFQFTIRPKLTKEKKEHRDMIFKIRTLLQTNYNTIPDFKNGDNPIVETRRFDMLRSKAIKEETRRQQIYFDKENLVEIYKNKRRVVSIMEQFVYSTRYKLTYAQQLRNKFNFHIRYKIGFSMALLRVIKMQQKTLYSTLENNLLKMSSLHVHMKIYERIVRLDVDMKDLITFIKGLERERKLIKDPTYYDDA